MQRVLFTFFFLFSVSFLFAQDAALFEAIEKNDLAQVQKLLKNDAKPNALHPKTRWSTLHYAVQAGNIEIVKLLLKKETNPNLQTPITDSAKGTGRFTPLHLAVQNQQVAIIKELLKGGAKTEIKAQAGLTPLHLAVKANNLEITTLLLDKNALINTKTTTNQAPLHLAIEAGNLPLLDVLLKKGADKEAPTRFYAPKQAYTWSCLLIAIWLDKSDVVQKLLDAGANVQYKTLENQNALHLAVEKNNAGLVSLLLEKGIQREVADKMGKTPLKLAYAKGNTEIIELLEGGTFYGGIHIDNLDIGQNTVSDNLQNNPMDISPTPDGGALVAWQDTSGNCHILRTDANARKIGGIVNLPKIIIFELLAHFDGFTILFAKEEAYDAQWKRRTYRKYYLGKYDYSGKLIFETKIIGDDDLEKEKNCVADSEGRNHNGLAWSGKYYAVYLAIYCDFGAKGDHQGDFLAFLDGNGKLLKDGVNTETDELIKQGGWDWGVSHSFSQRIMYDGKKFACLATGDSYPRGISFSRAGAQKKVVYAVGGGERQYQDILSTRTSPMFLGERGYIFAFMTHNAKPTQDIGLFNIDSTGKSIKQIWLTNTLDLDETHPRLANYGKDKFLLMWDVVKRKNPKNEEILGNIAKYYTEYAIVDKKGTILNKKPYHTEEVFYQYYLKKFAEDGKNIQYKDLDYGMRKCLASDKSEMINLNNGDIAYLRIIPDEQRLQLIRIKVEEK